MPVVSESFKADWETFQPNGASPTPWNDISAAYTPCPNVKPGEFILSSFTKFGNVGEAGVGNLTSVLIVRNGTFVRYLAAYNKSESRQFCQQMVPCRQPASEPNSPGDPITFPMGSLNVKSSWIDMRAFPIQSGTIRGLPGFRTRYPARAAIPL